MKNRKINEFFRDYKLNQIYDDLNYKENVNNNK